ncbi:MAG: hypothetical protein ACOY33_10140 [Pseudomonadota bacterium]
MKTTPSGRGRYLVNGLLLALPAWWLYASLNPVFEPEWEERSAGPFVAAPTPADAAPPYPHGDRLYKDFSVRFCEDCVARIRQAYLGVGAAPAPLPDDAAGLLHGNRFGQHAHAPFPAQPQPGDRLWLTVEDWHGQRHHASWALPEE